MESTGGEMSSHHHPAHQHPSPPRDQRQPTYSNDALTATMEPSTTYSEQPHQQSPNWSGLSHSPAHSPMRQLPLEPVGDQGFFFHSPASTQQKHLGTPAHAVHRRVCPAPPSVPTPCPPAAPLSSIHSQHYTTPSPPIFDSTPLVEVSASGGLLNHLASRSHTSTERKPSGLNQYVPPGPFDVASPTRPADGCRDSMKVRTPPPVAKINLGVIPPYPTRRHQRALT
jgi:hypothetical protein